jgi:hypothetical protein
VPVVEVGRRRQVGGQAAIQLAVAVVGLLVVQHRPASPGPAAGREIARRSVA